MGNQGEYFIFICYPGVLGAFLQDGMMFVKHYAYLANSPLGELRTDRVDFGEKKRSDGQMLTLCNTDVDKM